MNTKKLTAIVLSVLMVVVFCGACSAQGAVSVPALTAKPLAAPAYDPDSPTPGVVNGSNDFALRLSAGLVQQSPGGNFVCSPYSVWLPLAALLNATDDAHRAELLTALGAAGVSEADVNRAASEMLYRLTNENLRAHEDDAHNPLQIANAIFVDRNRQLNSTFAQLFMDNYRGQVMNVDFGSDEAVNAVNQWASDNTGGLITEIIKEFDPDVVASVANAIYFSDRWSWEFNEAQTRQGVFHAPGGDTTAMYMLREGDGLSYYEDDALQAVQLGFTTGGSMTILLPRDHNATGLLASLNGERYREISDSLSMSQRTGRLLLPRFKIESGVMELEEVLRALGVPLFDAQSLALTGLVDQPVFLQSAVQKAMIEVDEHGTTAAAVTLLNPATGGGPTPTAPFEMVCDSPFVFALSHGSSHSGEQILFTGVVNQP